MVSHVTDTRATESRQTPGLRLVLGQGLLVGAATAVGFAIVADGGLSRTLNGVGAAAWVIAAVLLAMMLRHDPGAGMGFGTAVGAAAVLAILVRPSDLVSAVIGFGIAGAAMSWPMRHHRLGWALLIPGIYLPLHVVVAISRSLIAGETTVRTEPPPTAPLVPLAMVLAAAIASVTVSWFRQRAE